MAVQVSVGPSHLCHCPLAKAVCHHSQLLVQGEGMSTRSSDLTNMLSVHFIQVFNKNPDQLKGHSLKLKGKDPNVDQH